MIKIAHLADIHIRNLKYHDVYTNVFEQLYENLKIQKPDYIVVCGDIAHTKTQISPEYVKMASNFFINLANIAQTVVIPGNHDGLVKNVSRLDAISPIIENIKSDKLFFLRESGVFSFKDVDFYHLSIFDRDNWPALKTNKKLKIALYHGSISQVKTDVGFTISHGDDEISIFNGFDFALLGDIHKTNQIIDKDGRVRYPGSLITQNFGETNDKGYLVWEIKNANDFQCNHIQLVNPKPFITINLTPKGRLPKNLIVPKNSRVRLVSDYHVSLDDMRKAIDVVKLKYKPESISFLNRADKNKNTKNVIDDEYSKKNLRDLAVQEELIKNFLKDYELEKDMIDEIISINKNINSIIEKNDDIARNVSWELNSLEYDNLFNYGPGNKINFDNLSGLIGIFGKSFSGKSSIVDSLLYTLFNNTSKSVRKNYDMINQHKPYGFGRAILTINNDRFAIERKSTKYSKKLHGTVTQEAKTEIDFFQVDADNNKIPDSELNGESRNDTDKMIRNKIGNLEDFLVTSFAAQFGSLVFIDQKSTDRKKILAKFLDLEFFEEKFKEANERSSHLRGALKHLESTDYMFELDKLKEDKQQLDGQFLTLSALKKQLKIELEEKERYLVEINNYIQSVPKELEEISHLEENLIENRKEKNRLEVYCEVLIKQLQEKQEMLANIKKEIETFDEHELNEAKVKKETIFEKLNAKFEDKTYYSNLISEIEEAEKNIVSAPCNSTYSSCSLVEKSYNILSRLGDSLKLREKLEKIKEEYEKLENDHTDLVNMNIDKQISEIQNLKNNIENLQNKEIPLLSALIEKEKTEIDSLLTKINNLESKMVEYYQSKEKIDALEDKKIEKKEYEVQIQELKKSVEKNENELNKLFSKKGSISEKINNLISEREKLEKMRKEYTAYDLYKKCMHSNGIPFDIIKRKLPVINSEISKILANVVEFEVFFETSDNRLEVYIKHPKHEARLIETGSGAEKTLAATAIRLALLTVSSLPKGDIFILDEPATELDDETKEGFLRILEMIKNYFTKVIMISHLEPLKDIVDMEITIEQKNGYAHIVI